MAIHLKLCGSGKTKPKNTGANEQCFEGVLDKGYVAKKAFRFANQADFENVSVWKTAIKNKDIVPLYSAYSVTPANVDAKNFENGNFSIQTAKAIKKTTFESYLSFCSHSALKSYANSEYTQLFELTESGAIIGVNTADGKIKGQDITLAVDIRTIQVSDKVPTSKVTLTYRDYEELEDNANVFIPTWDASESLQGIFDVYLVQTSANSTTIKFTASSGCAGGGSLVNSLVAGNLVLKNVAGVVQTVTFGGVDSNGVYTLTGTGFANGFTLSLNGVVEQTTIMYESPESMIVAI